MEKSTMEGVPEIMTTAQLCDYLQVTRQTLLNWRNAEMAPPAVTLRGRKRYFRRDVLEWLADRYV
jgi:DNA-binding transcriptional MerR regulator